MDSFMDVCWCCICWEELGFDEAAVSEPPQDCRSRLSGPQKHIAFATFAGKSSGCEAFHMFGNYRLGVIEPLQYSLGVDGGVQGWEQTSAQLVTTITSGSLAE